MNHVSPCCHAEVGSDLRLEHPHNDRFFIAYKVDRCQSCGKEVEEYAEACGICGVVGCKEDCDESNGVLDACEAHAEQSAAVEIRR